MKITPLALNLLRSLITYFCVGSLLLTNFVAFNGFAQTKNDDSITLTTAIKKTLKVNPSLNVFKYRKNAIDGELQSEQLTPGYSVYFEIEDFAGTSDIGVFDGTEYTLSLSSVFEMGDKANARVDVVNSRSAQLTAQRKIAALSLSGEVTRRYIDILAAQERTSLAKEAVVLAEHTLTEVESRAKAGAAPEAEVKRALAALGNIKLIASSEQQQFEYAKVLLAMMWKETTPSFTRVEGDLFNFANDIPFDLLYAKVEQNPEILSYAAETRVKEAQLRLAQTESSEDIQWSVGLKQYQAVNDTALIASISVPLFSSQRNKGAIISAQAQRDEIAVKREISLLALHSQLYRAYSNRKQAIFTVKNLKDAIVPILTDALNETQIAYQRGLYSYLEYLTARQELLFARRAMIESAAAALRYGTEIEQLIAEPLPATQHGITIPMTKQ
ncbi:TolC family protein [Colwellia echini]|uniref:TolC family protein n=1 Tax=Colwellia echini TaxID=1982103 RepID=A0ABY3MX43_9GAMM|nr:TolC family protein [Colwellia echini]TYK65780.1 TolC family protein [Colwellia echini]